ncbi:MAG: hypothetical protein ABL962_09765 [Fimbriimonadaceae bacterium]
MKDGWEGFAQRLFEAEDPYAARYPAAAYLVFCLMSAILHFSKDIWDDPGTTIFQFLFDPIWRLLVLSPVIVPVGCAWLLSAFVAPIVCGLLSNAIIKAWVPTLYTTKTPLSRIACSLLRFALWALVLTLLMRNLLPLYVDWLGNASPS